MGAQGSSSRNLRRRRSLLGALGVALTGHLRALLAMAQYYTPEQYAALQQQRAAQLLQQQQQQQLPQQRTVQLTLPADAAPGRTYEFEAPDGGKMSFQVPQGYGPGMPIVVSY